MKNSMMTVALVLVAAFGGFATSAQASQLQDGFNLGDVWGNYSTSYYSDSKGGTTAQLYGNLGGMYKIDNASLSFAPNYTYTYDPTTGNPVQVQAGYEIDMYMSGHMAPLGATDTGNQNQSNSIDARGININMNTWIDVYNSAPYGSTPLNSNSGSFISISNFVVSNANGRYLESPAYGDPSVTNYQYQIDWYGDFLPGTLPAGFIPPSMGTEVPEPATLSLLAAGGLSLIRRHNKR
jgi:hypothetical protein